MMNKIRQFKQNYQREINIVFNILLIVGLIIWFRYSGLNSFISFLFGMIAMMYIFLTNYTIIDMILTFTGLKNGIKEKQEIKRNKKYKVKFEE